MKEIKLDTCTTSGINRKNTKAYTVIVINNPFHALSKCLCSLYINQSHLPLPSEHFFLPTHPHPHCHTQKTTQANLFMAHHFIPSDTQTSSLLSIDPNMGILTNFPELSPADLDNSNFNIHNLLNGFSQDCFFSQLPEFPGNLAENFPAFFPPSDHHPLTCATNDHHHQHKKRKEMDDTPETSNSANSSPPVSENGIRRKNVSPSPPTPPFFFFNILAGLLAW